MYKLYRVNLESTEVECVVGVGLHGKTNTTRELGQSVQ